MTVYRTTENKSPGSNGIPAPAPWRHSPTSSGRFIPAGHLLSGAIKNISIIFQLLLTAFLLTYICLPSHAVKRITSKASLTSVSSAGRSALHSVSEVIQGRSDEGPGRRRVAIVAACRNRHDVLAKVLPTWFAVPEVEEIVLIDWSSDPPLRPIVQRQGDGRLTLYRVNKEKSWVLTRAYNLALKKTTKDYIIRTDCDYSLDRAILEAHNLSATETGFYSGNWRLARDENEVHLNGAMVMKRELFWSVGGYDERIQTYGWDDDDLYTRLTANNVEKLNVSYNHFSHVSHGDRSRTQRGVKFARVQIDLNQLLLQKLPQWSRSMLNTGESSTYRVVKENTHGYVELEAVSVPEPLRHRVAPEVYEETWALALGRRLANDYHVPWDILESMDSKNKELLLRSLMSLQDVVDNEVEERANGNSAVLKQGVLPKNPRMLLVHCMHGLGNRLRALGSALAFARNTRRVPVIIWEGDAHITAEFEALFNASSLIVLKTFIPKWPFTGLEKYDTSWQHFDFYNYMEMEEGAKKGEPIVNDPEKHLYYKGAYVMEAPAYSWWEADNDELRKLEPVGMIHAHLKELEALSLTEAIGVHIRNRTLSADIKNVDFEREYGSKEAATLEHWRTQSYYQNFVTEMRRIIRKEDADATFYIASDTYKIISVMEKKFPGRILSTKRSCDDRDSECVKYAVIDLYALSRTKKLLGSNWSSYTEMVERLGGLKARLAGQDFGPAARRSPQKAVGEEDVRKSASRIRERG